MELFILLVLIVLAVALAVYLGKRKTVSHAQMQLDDAKTDARRWIERLGGQVLNLQGTDNASKQALADASERYNAASSQIEQTKSIPQAKMAKETALEGLYYIRAARSAMGMIPGPDLPDLHGQGQAGSVSEDREVQVEGRNVAASPNPSARTPNYYPGGRVAGRPVPAGWYSEPWWKPALIGGAWGLGSMLLFDAMFSGMSGVGYDSQAFESGYGAGYDQGFDQGQFDQGQFDQGQQDMGGDGGQDVGAGYDQGGFDQAGFDGGQDFGGQDFSGQDFGGGDWGGGFGDFF